MASLERHPVPDTVDPEAWRLDVTGAVERPRRFARSDLLAMATGAVTDDFDCVEGWTASDLRWEGVSLDAVLDAARPRDGAAWGLVHAMDGDYACALVLDRLRTALLALRLDGAPLPVEHGGPARLVLPGDSDCWESVKWVTRLEVLDREPRHADTAQALALSRVDG